MGDVCWLCQLFPTAMIFVSIILLHIEPETQAKLRSLAIGQERFSGLL